MPTLFPNRILKRIFVLSIAFFLTQIHPALPQSAAATPEETWEKKHADEAILVLEYSIALRLNKDFSYSETVHTRERIQNEAGMSEGEQVITYNSRHDKVRFIKARLILPEGKSYPPKMVQDVDTAQDGDYSDVRQKVITMPNVVVGSIIDIEYEIFHKQGPLKGHFFAGMPINSTQPIKHAFCQLTVPDSIKLYIKKLNTNQDPVITSAKGQTTYFWESKLDNDYDENWDQENFTPPYIDAQPYISISTLKDWDAFADIYAGLFGHAIVTSPAIKKTVESIVKDKRTDIEKIEAIHKYLYKNFRYVAVNLNNHDFIPHSAVEVFQNKFGDCKDQSILFITMLKEAGIKAYPVLIRKEGPGDFRKLLDQAFAGWFSGLKAGAKV